MRFQMPLEPARLIRRYKRFLADIRLEADGRSVVAHCPNPGAMTGLAEPGTRIWVEPNDDPKKKLKFGWRLTEVENGALVCVDTGIANRLVSEGLRYGIIPEFGKNPEFLSEVRFGGASRVDFMVMEKQKKHYLEVKSATFVRKPRVAEFPDTVTKRGAKHLRELKNAVLEGHKATLLYVVQRTDCAVFKVAGDIDDEYAEAANDARTAGVNFLAYSANITPEELTIGGPVSIGF